MYEKGKDSKGKWIGLGKPFCSSLTKSKYNKIFLRSTKIGNFAKC